MRLNQEASLAIPVRIGMNTVQARYHVKMS